jgi:hypothetical protein
MHLLAMFDAPTGAPSQNHQAHLPQHLLAILPLQLPFLGLRISRRPASLGAPQAMALQLPFLGLRISRDARVETVSGSDVNRLSGSGRTENSETDTAKKGTTANSQCASMNKRLLQDALLNKEAGKSEIQLNTQYPFSTKLNDEVGKLNGIDDARVIYVRKENVPQEPVSMRQENTQAQVIDTAGTDGTGDYAGMTKGQLQAEIAKRNRVVKTLLIEGEQDLILVGRDSYENRERGAELLVHEAAHAYYFTLSPEERSRLRVLFLYETRTKT